MRQTVLSLILAFSWGRALAQEASGPPMSLAQTKPVINLTNELRDVWPGIATATNQWALDIRRLPDWNQVTNVTISEAVALAEKGIALAQLRLGYSYFVGEGIEQDYMLADRWLLKAAESPLPPAQFLLGVAYLDGLGVPQQFEAAIEQVNRAAEKGFAAAEFQLGLCYLRGGPGVNQAPARGIKWLLRAAEQGRPNAQQFVAWCFASGTGTDEDPAQAFYWCRKAAQQGMDTAQDFLGMFYGTGYGTNQDWAQALTWFRLAADQGLATAQMHLAQCYANGKGTPTDPAQAFSWWLAAAKKGYPSAQFHSGLALYQGTGAQRDAEAGVGWLEKAAKQQHVGAQLYLGLLYWKGIGVAKDLEAAQKWWQEAALRGISHRLPEMGDDPADVRDWWQRVAAQGSPRIQCCLAEFYRFGQGVSPDDIEALKWYRKASDSGDLRALQAAAWLLATSPNNKARDGRAAVELARKAVAATNRKDARSLDILAASYAESLQFGKAMSTEKEAIALTQDEDLRAEYVSRLKLYQVKVPFRTPDAPLRPLAE